MVFAARVAEVVIASPDDTDRFRPAIGQALNWWNAARGQRHEIVLMPSDRGDVFIAVFDPARRDVVQLMGDVERAQRAGKLVLAWLLAESPSSHALSSDDQAWLGDIVHRLSKVGIIPRYLGPCDAQFQSRLHTAITADLTPHSLGNLVSEFEKASSARRLRIYRTPVALLGPQIWAVTVVNHSASLVVGLRVSVAAADSEGRDRPGGARRCRQAIADVVAKLKAGPWPDEHHPLRDPHGMLAAQQPIFLGSRKDLLAAHNVLDFPRWLRPNQHASALYSLEPNASPSVRITFEDEAGEVWCRANDAEPERVSSTSRSSGDLRGSAGAGE